MPREKYKQESDRINVRVQTHLQKEEAKKLKEWCNKNFVGISAGVRKMIVEFLSIKGEK